MQIPEHSKPSHVESPFFLKSGVTVPESVYDGTNPNKTNIWMSVGKLLKRPKLDVNKIYMKRAIELAWQQLQVILITSICPTPTITHDTSCALWWREFGFKDKDEVLRHPLFGRALKLCRDGDRMYPPYAIAGKRELLKIDEILQHKIRTFLMTSLELLMDSKFLYENQNELMKQLQPGGICYGINFHDGGFNKLIQSMIHNDFFWMCDVSGWDRQLSHIYEAQQLRNKGLKEFYKGTDFWDSIKELTERVSYYKSHHPLLLPDGSVVYFDGLIKDSFFNENLEIVHGGKYSSGWAQMSGDSDTTTNNCIVHLFYTNYILIKANPEARDEEIIEQNMFKYGDDILAGNTNQFQKLKEKNFIRDCYRDVGLDVKDGSFKLQDTPVGLQFLGATIEEFVYKGDTLFIPSYSKERIMAALQLSCDTLDYDSELMKAYSLLELGWKDCYEEISAYIRYLLKQPYESSVKTSFLKKGIPSRYRIQLAWAGVSE